MSTRNYGVRFFYLIALLVATAAIWLVWLFGFGRLSTISVTGLFVTWIVLAGLVLLSESDEIEGMPVSVILIAAAFQLVFLWSAFDHSNAVYSIYAKFREQVSDAKPSGGSQQQSINKYHNSVRGTDSLGFLSSRARCSPDAAPLLLLRSTSGSQPGSKVVICRTRNSQIYYAGARDSPTDRGIVVTNVVPTNSGYRAYSTDNYTYEISPQAFTIYRNGTPVSRERVVEYWSSS